MTTGGGTLASTDQLVCLPSSGQHALASTDQLVCSWPASTQEDISAGGI